MKKSTTKRALLMSVLSMFLCFTMLIGTTFAWFTDEVKSGTNQIIAGNLDVELTHTNKTVTAEEPIEGNTKLFEDVTDEKWEPNAMAMETFYVKNLGNLALKYKLSLNITDATVGKDRVTSFASVLKVAVVNGTVADRAAVEALDATVWMPFEDFAKTGDLMPTEVGGVADIDTWTVIIWWQPSDIDNNFNMNNGETAKMTATFGINLFATQLEAESDSFGEDYDKEAAQSIKVVAASDGSATLSVNNAPSTINSSTVIDAPAGAFDANDEVAVVVNAENSLFNVSAGGAVVGTLNVDLSVNGAETSGDLASGYYTVTTYISMGLADVAVAYTGTDGKAQPINVTYDANTGKLTFQTNHFSEYAVSGTALAYDVVSDTALVSAEAVVEAMKNENSDVQFVADIPAEKNNEIIDAIENAGNEIPESVVANIYEAKIGEKNYTSFVLAMAEVKDGEMVTLLKDVTVDADNTIVITNTITIELGGNTLAGVSDQTGKNHNMIDVRGTLTAKNGTLTIEHIGSNMGWNNSTNVFNVTAGGVLNIEDATVENLGGSDMAFGVHLNNWGEVTINVENSTLKSTYIAVRVFNSGKDMNNVTIKDSTLEGKYCLWVHNYTVADFGTVEKADHQKTLLNFDIFENGNTFTNTSKAPVLYGFTDSVYLDANGNVITE